MFKVGAVYLRNQLHSHLGGQPFSRISTPSDSKMVFLFGVNGPEVYGYANGWTAYGVFRFTGEGRFGHMAFTRGNRAIRQHTDDGKEIHLFLRLDPEFQLVRYVGQMRYSAHYYKEGLDEGNELRRMIVFLLKPVAEALFTPEEALFDHRKAAP